MPVTVNAFLAINKPAGITSFEVIRRLRRITGIRKIGHTGTLDPLATGLLICCTGSYTRLSCFLEKEEKTYLATMKLGAKTSTGDTEGEIIQTAPVPIFADKLAALEAKALDLAELSVPAYSAVKIQGKRAYELARQGKILELPMRPVKISEFKFLVEEQNAPDELTYRCKVSKGTYIRALSEWLAEQIQTLAYTISLKRESIGKITLQDAVALEDLKTDNWTNSQISYERVFPDWTCLKLNDEELYKVINGMDIEFSESSSDIILLLNQDELCALGKKSNNVIHPFIVLK